MLFFIGKKTKNWLRKVPHRFEVHSNESACRKSGRLGLEQVMNKMNEKIESKIILEVTESEGAIRLLISFEYTVILEETGSTIQNTPHYTSRVLCATKYVNCQHNKDATIYHYYQ